LIIISLLKINSSAYEAEILKLRAEISDLRARLQVPPVAAALASTYFMPNVWSEIDTYQHGLEDKVEMHVAEVERKRAAEEEAVREKERQKEREKMERLNKGNLSTKKAPKPLSTDAHVFTKAPSESESAPSTSTSSFEPANGSSTDSNTMVAIVPTPPSTKPVEIPIVRYMYVVCRGCLFDFIICIRCLCFSQMFHFYRL
jgi:hypothetical protein